MKGDKLDRALLLSIEHARQNEDEALDWLRNVKGIRNTKVLEAFTVGFRRGWERGAANWRLHNPNGVK